jgi:Lon protease-like protein|tara:strand:+ start:10856 stop:11485 length:630 start_codon:yes stop_codon:yes gene_type:complete
MKEEFPKIIPVFPLNGVIYFPKTNLPLNIFEERYLELVDDAYKKDKLMGMVQSKKDSNSVYQVGCLGKISDYNKTKDGRLLINLTGLTRFEIKKEIIKTKKYREFQVDYDKFDEDKIIDKKYILKKENMDFLLKKSKLFFEKNGLLLNWKEFEKLDQNQQVNTISMIAPISNEEKQKLLETIALNDKSITLLNIIEFYLHETNQKLRLQ